MLKLRPQELLREIIYIILSKSTSLDPFIRVPSNFSWTSSITCETILENKTQICVHFSVAKATPLAKPLHPSFFFRFLACCLSLNLC